MIPRHEYSGKFIYIYGSDGRRFKTQVLGRRPHIAHICLAHNLAFPKDVVSIPENNYQGTVPGVAYSAGIDSASAMAILDNGIALYLNDGSGFCRFATKSLLSIRTDRIRAYTVDCNVQRLRRPYGFPTDLAVAIPLIINAVHFDLDSIATGTIMESAYNIGRGRYGDFPRTGYWLNWNNIFTSVGLPLNFVVGGLSEVATFNIANRLNLKAKSCLRRPMTSCRRCYKCYRRAAISGELLPMNNHTRYNILKKHHTNILDYAYHKHDIKFYSKSVKQYMGYLEKWYPNSIELIVPKYREQVTNNINNLLPTMDSNDISILESYGHQ